MADISSYTHKWRAAPAASQQNEGNRVNKRNRQPLSCAPCRSRKLKCDRGHPCDACTKRNEEGSCVYGKAAIATTARQDEAKPSMKAQERLRHLEELVKQMIGPTTNLPTPQTPPTDDLHRADGSLHKIVDGINYTGSTHWATVLDQIQELQHTLSPTASTDDNASVRNETGRETSLFGAPFPPPLSVIIQKYLPPRDECNRYLSTYFNAKYNTPPFVHIHQFKRQYEDYWNHQAEVSPVWMSLLFSILCIADTVRRAPLSVYRTGYDFSKPPSPFLSASAQCLILGNYIKPQPFLIEALAMHCQCKYVVTLDPSHEVGTIFSVMTRQAYTMGYHREPSVFGNHFTAFECEMRRRTWCLVRQFDLMVSFQLGLPGTLQPDASDTQLPSHLLDEDFDEDTVVLPPGRPDTEPTQMLYLITKARLMETYGKICQHTLAFPKQPVVPSDIARLDTAITQNVESVPVSLRARPMSLAYVDPPNLTMIRSNLKFLGEKARCILHRKYMVSGPDTDLSRRKCITASTIIINHFLDLHAELQPDGQLFNDRWMMTSFTINDFLLGLMVLCLAFSLGRKKYIADGGDPQRWLEEDAGAKTIFTLLEKAQPVCAQYGTKAKEARHVSEAVSLLLRKINPNSGLAHQDHRTDFTGPTPFTMNTQSSMTSSGATEGESMPLNIAPLSIHNTDPTTQLPNPQSDFASMSSLDHGTSTNSTLTFSNPTDPSPASSWEMTDGPLPNILDGPEQIDWIQFDQFLSTFGMANTGEEEIL